MSNDCSYGVTAVQTLLKRLGMQDKWCFVDAQEHYHGLTRDRIVAVFKSADLFLDMGTHGAWLPEAAATRLRVLADGEPGFTQIKMAQQVAAGEGCLATISTIPPGATLVRVKAQHRQQVGTGGACFIRSSPTCFATNLSIDMRRSLR